MVTTATALICPQGHGPGVPGSRFCTFCGVPLVNGVAPNGVAPGQPEATGAVTAPMAAAAGQPVAGAPAAMPAAQWQPVAAQPVQPMPAVPVAAPAPAATAQGARVCGVCGGNGAGLAAALDVCPECAWLRPLLPGYQLERKVFLWAQDGQAMARLQSLPPLHAVVRSVSDKVGRPWIESTFNAIRLGPKQLPGVWKRAVLAARILGVPNMPDVYISGDQMWNTYTYGTETNFFIVLGTSHIINFADDELLFVLAREMGHCRAGHALWKTVTRFVAGDTSVHSGLLSDGLINALHPSNLIKGAIDLPLMAWARQSEITADRAGLLAVGDEALARRVLLAWAVRSARLLQQVNIEEWLKQEDASDDQMTRFSEMTTSSSMYTTRRLRLLGQAAREPELMRWSQSIQPVRKKLAPASAQMQGLGVGTVRAAKPGAAAPPRPAGSAAGPVGPAAGTVAQARPGPAVPVYAAQAIPIPGAAGGAAPAAAPAGSIRVVCNKCQAAMGVPLAVLRGKTVVNVRCPQCQNVLTMRARGSAAAAAPAPGAARSAAASQPPAGSANKPTAPPPAPVAAAKPVVSSPAPAAAAPRSAAPSALAGTPPKPAAPAQAGAAKQKVAAPPSPTGAGKKSAAAPPANVGAKR